MTGEFILKHNNRNKEGNILKFTPFCESERKAKVIAIRFRKFMRNHVSASQYNAILREFRQDFEITENLRGKTIAVKGDHL